MGTAPIKFASGISVGRSLDGWLMGENLWDHGHYHPLAGEAGLCEKAI